MRYIGDGGDGVRLDTVRWARRLLLATALVGILVGAGLIWNSASAGGGPTAVLRLLGLAGSRPTWHVGIVPGHSGSDSGAVCPDGLTEAEINQAVAEALVRALRRRGVTVDLLQEFDDRLQGYQGDAFVSIHSDSCEVDLSGYKVASLEGGSDASEHLAECLWERYGAVTRLPPHPNTITYDMSRYHAFREISPTTPAAIIEIGFLKADRKLLANRPDRVAQGILAGLDCFLTDQSP
jgi:N-acetylmuramoyl-L-alanine amidase